MQKKMLLYLGMLIVLVLAVMMPYITRIQTDIVVYGGSFAGCAAARNAALTAPEKKVLLLVPESTQDLGGLGTIGGQNFADIRYWQNKIVTVGTFSRWYNEAGQFYNTKKMAEIIKQDLLQYPNLAIMYSYDIKSITQKNSEIKNIRVAQVCKDEDGIVKWAKNEKTINARVFIDASDDGRLVRMSGAPATVGRQDWPSDLLPQDERQGDWARQQAVTLMFKIGNVKTPKNPKGIGDLIFTRDGKGSWAMIGGKETWKNNSIVQDFNEKYKDLGFSIKPINAAQDGAGNEQWWVNMLLIFNVDARAHEKDKGTRIYPNIMLTTYTVDEAWSKARDLLLETDFSNALQQFKVNEGQEEYGFGEAVIIMDDNCKPIVGEVLYIRESIHGQMAGLDNPSGSESYNYAVTSLETQLAGINSQTGEDKDNYQSRIGLGYYMMDINAYQPVELINNGEYYWPVTRWLRPDWWAAGGGPVNPVYLPYRMLIVDNINNLLVPGYATSCSSFAWSELRVLPNLTVLGDAAGVAAARAVLYNESPRKFGVNQISWIQEKLELLGARLDK